MVMKGKCENDAFKCELRMRHDGMHLNRSIKCWYRKRRRQLSCVVLKRMIIVWLFWMGNWQITRSVAAMKQCELLQLQLHSRNDRSHQIFMASCFDIGLRPYLRIACAHDNKRGRCSLHSHTWVSVIKKAKMKKEYQYN